MTRRMAVVSTGAVALAGLVITTVVYRDRATRPEASAPIEARAEFAAQ